MQLRDRRPTSREQLDPTTSWGCNRTLWSLRPPSGPFPRGLRRGATRARLRRPDGLFKTGMGARRPQLTTTPTPLTQPVNAQYLLGLFLKSIAQIITIQ